jgi:hypothetical protein
MSLAKWTFAAGAVTAGLIIGQAAAGRVSVVAGLAVIVAAANGYSKAYSP